MPACGISDNEGSRSVFPEPAAIVKNVSKMSAAGSSRPPVQDCRVERLRLDDRYNLMRAGIDDHDLLADQDVVIATPFRIDHEDLLWQRVHVHARGDARPDAYRHVQIDPLNLLFPDNRTDLGTLFGRQLG